MTHGLEMLYEFSKDSVGVLDHKLTGKRTRHIWSACIVRQDHVCRICKRVIKKGNQAFRPGGNNNNRMNRAHGACLRKTFRGN